MTSYRLMDGASGRPGTGSSGTQPPTTATALTGPYVVGTAFKTTTPCWLEGYWWWVTSSGGQPTAAQKFCLWSANIDGSNSNRGSVIPAATITSGTLTTGWNFIPLTTPVPLTIGWTYLVTTGGASFPGIAFTNAQFGAGNPYSAGITNGPLTGFSNTGGSNPDPFGNLQCGYDRTAGNPAVNFPTTDGGSFNGWIDPQVTNVAPAGSTYRLFPSLEGWQTGPGPDYNNTGDPSSYTIGNTFTLTQPCQLLKLWFLSQPTAAGLPTHCGVWDVQTQTVVSGTDNASPAWKTESGATAAAGAGWVYVDYSGAGITLPSGRNMIAAVFSPTATAWRPYSLPFWGSGGISGGPAINIGASGLDYGVISAPGTVGGTPLQGGYLGPGLGWGFPGSWNNPENDWTDIEVSPLTQVTAGIPVAAGTAPAPTAQASLTVNAGIPAGTGGVALPATSRTAAAGAATATGGAAATIKRAVTSGILTATTQATTVLTTTTAP